MTVVIAQSTTKDAVRGTAYCLISLSGMNLDQNGSCQPPPSGADNTSRDNMQRTQEVHDEVKTWFL